MNLRQLIMLTFLGAAFCCLGMAGMAGAQPTAEMDSANFSYKYEFDVDPTDPLLIDLDDNDLADWQKQGEPDVTTTPGIAKFSELTMIDPADGYYCYEDDATIWWGDITGAYTIEVSVKAITTGPEPSIYSGLVYASSPNADTYACLFYSPLGQRWCTGSPHYIVLGNADDVNSDDFHVFRIAKEEDESYWVWRDGVLLNPDGERLPASDPYTRRFLGFQAGSGKAEGEVDADYFRFTAGAYAPEGGAQPPLPGDANLDNIVNDADASILAAHWQQTEMGWGDGDFNDDQIVNDADASILAAHWQETQEGTAPVPEPATVVLLAFAAVSLLVWRRRK